MLTYIKHRLGCLEFSLCVIKMAVIHLFKGLHPNVYVVSWDSIAKSERKKILDGDQRILFSHSHFNSPFSVLFGKLMSLLPVLISSRPGTQVTGRCLRSATWGPSGARLREKQDCFSRPVPGPTGAQVLRAPLGWHWDHIWGLGHPLQCPAAFTEMPFQCLSLPITSIFFLF